MHNGTETSANTGESVAGRAGHRSKVILGSLRTNVTTSFASLVSTASPDEMRHASHKEYAQLMDRYRQMKRMKSSSDRDNGIKQLLAVRHSTVCHNNNAFGLHQRNLKKI